MELWLLDDTLHIKIFFEDTDQDLQDNICVSIFESLSGRGADFVA